MTRRRGTASSTLSSDCRRRSRQMARRCPNARSEEIPHNLCLSFHPGSQIPHPRCAAHAPGRRHYFGAAGISARRIARSRSWRVPARERAAAATTALLDRPQAWPICGLSDPCLSPLEMARSEMSKAQSGPEPEPNHCRDSANGCKEEPCK
jgi:hypothetical protein